MAIATREKNGVSPVACGLAAGGALFFLCLVMPAVAQDGTDENFNLHGQFVFVEQYHPPFHSPYRGANSLDPGSRGDETISAGVEAGARIWDGLEAYADAEIDQGFGLSGTLGAAGFPSGEAYKVGADIPYFRLQRLFLRQTIDLGGETQNVDDGANQLAGQRTADNLVITAGKFSVTDIFDTNAYAHDPSADFLNWAVIDAGAFDYAADAWGYSYGGTAEWTQSWWTLRGGVFALSRIPNSRELQTDFSQFSMIGEAEERHTLWGAAGKLKLLGYVNRGRMGSYEDALALARLTGDIPNTALVRRYASRPGGELNLEQGIMGDLGAFARLGVNDGSEEAYEFTEINRSLSAGLSLKGTQWNRPDDTAGAAFVVNEMSNASRAYFAAGGIGILIGDGRLPHYGVEQILETYYSANLASWLAASADYQFIANPAYNRDRGPVSVLGIRLHAQL
jgi:high affinity Mn2+ porin